MMLLNELTLRRFRIHDSLTVKLNAGVTGIVGRNGAGKSSIIEAIGFLFTGEADDAKEDVITAGTTGSAYVRGRFTLNGKEGVIERSLDTSRVTLEYDGQKLVKAGEVKELWSKLLQVDSHIFQHVITARQKKIPELFSGDNAVREKAFQRIFMVPNTDRLRSMIWDNYIKTCPPPLPEDNLYVLDQQLAKLQSELEPKQDKLTLISTSVLSEQQMLAVVNYTDFYNRCIQDAEKRPVLEARLAEASHKLEETIGQITALQAQLVTYPADLDHQYADLLVREEKNRAYLMGVVAANNARTRMTNMHVDRPVLMDEIGRLDAAVRQAEGDLRVLESDIQKLEAELTSLRGLTSSPTCPTCHQPLKDVASHVLEIQTALNDKRLQRAELGNGLQAQSGALRAKQSLLTQWESLQNEVILLESQLTGFTAGDDYEKKLEAVNLLRSCKYADETNLARLMQLKVQFEATIAIVTEQIRHLVSYDGASTPAEELTLMQEVLQRHRVRIQEIGQLEREVVQLRTEIQMLEQRRETSRINHEKNLDRNEYDNKLRMAYEALHTTRFPRKLIQTYSSVVEDELRLQLQRFDLPYDARINEDFRIVVTTKEGHTVPRLSGGQEMVVGLCLRLALHSMFSQAFPMLIIDEGTTHLDDENKKLYFQCINDLKTDKVIQQLIIIDHSSLLVDAVDHVIKL